MDPAGEVLSEPAPSPRVAPPLVSSPPVIMAPRSDGCEVVWAVTGPARGWVEWAPAGDGTDGAGSGDPEPTADDVHIVRTDAFGFVPQGTEVLRVRLDGMQPGAHHLLRTVTEATVTEATPTDTTPTDATPTEEDPERRVVSAWKPFRTLDPDASTTSFVVWSDTHQHVETLERLDDVTPHADFWVWNGDVCNNWRTDDAFAETVLSPAGRDVTLGRPMAFTWGNHDVRGRWAYRLPEFVATPEGRPYYALRSGPIAAVFLQTGEDRPDDHPSFKGRPSFTELRRRQADWLADQLRQPGFVDAPYRLVFCHIPLRWSEEPTLTADDYATGSFDGYALTSRELWQPLLTAWGAQVVLSGHQHEAAVLPATAEFPYVQVVGGGWEPETATWMEAHAGPDALTITVRSLDGPTVHEVTLPPLA